MLEILNLSDVEELIINERRLGPSESIVITELERPFWAEAEDVIQAIADGLCQVRVNGTGIETLNGQINALKLLQEVPKTQVQKIPKVAVYDAEGDFNSFVSHDFCQSSSWNNGQSEWILEPPQGRVMFLKKAEVQFTHDVQIAGLTELYFDIMAFNPADLPNRVVVQRVAYKSIKDVLNIGNSHYTMPAVDDIQHASTTVQFNYPRAIPLKSSQGMQVRLSLKDNVAISGEFCTVSFVTAEEDE